MLPDYYKILRVSTTANDIEIAKAFRQRAIECHPDRGGSHEAMKLVIEAWQILSNPETRRRYDVARSRQSDAAAQAAAAADAQRAAAASGDYPPIWEDFVKANYGKTTSIWGVPFPTVRNSTSGVIFIGLGAAFGLLFLASCISLFLPAIWQTRNYFFIAMTLILGGAAPGAWLATWLHSSIQKELLKPGPRPAPSGGAGAGCVRPEIIICPHCGRKLRVMSGDNLLWVTCPKCGEKFDHQMTPSSGKSSSAGFIAAGYICGLLALFVLPPAFALAGVVCGLVNLAKGRTGHGVAQVAIAIGCGALGLLPLFR